MSDYDQYELPDCGLYHLSVLDACALIIADLLLTGMPLGSLSIDGQISRLSEDQLETADEVAYHDFKKLKEQSFLHDVILTLSDVLVGAIDKGELKPAIMRRDFDGELDNEGTILSVKDLEKWLYERSYESGDAFQQFFEWESDIHARVLSVIHWERYQLKERLIAEAKCVETEDQAKFIEHLIEKLSELEHEKKMFLDHIPITEKTPSAKSKNSYLRTISSLAAALIEGRTGRPHQDAQVVLNAICAAGIEFPIDERTLANYLKEADKLMD